MNQQTEVEYINNEWNNPEKQWQIWYGYRKDYFLHELRLEMDKLKFPEAFKSKPKISNNIEYDKIDISELSLYDMETHSDPRVREKGMQLREGVFEKSKEIAGNYVCQISGFKSKNKLDFHIHHKIPLEDGGKTILSNLQLISRKEHVRLHSKYQNSNFENFKE